MSENEFDLDRLNRLVEQDRTSKEPEQEGSENNPDLKELTDHPDFVKITDGKFMSRIEFEEIRDQIHYVDEKISRLETDLDRAQVEEDRRHYKKEINSLLDEKKQLMGKIGRTEQMTDFRHPI